MNGNPNSPYSSQAAPDLVEKVSEDAVYRQVCRRLAFTKRRQAAEVSVEELEEILAMPWAKAEPARRPVPPVSRVRVRTPVAAMSARRIQPQPKFKAEYATGDLIDYKPRVPGAWSQGRIVLDEGGPQVEVRPVHGDLIRRLPRRQVRRPEDASRLRAELDQPRVVSASEILQVRTVYAGPAELHRIEKPPPPWRCKRYRTFVAQHPCDSCLTTEGVVAHHHGGEATEKAGGQQVGDEWCVALCWRCHTGPNGFHATGRLRGRPELQSKEAVDSYLHGLQVRRLGEYFTTGSSDEEEAGP